MAWTDRWGGADRWGLGWRLGEGAGMLDIQSTDLE